MNTESPKQSSSCAADLPKLATRHETISSIGSKKHHPLPQGHWAIAIQGSCPRGHHHYHYAVNIRIKINAYHESVNRVQCENCNQGWLVFLGNNVTSLSLLSVQTIKPVGIENEVRETLGSQGINVSHHGGCCGKYDAYQDSGGCIQDIVRYMFIYDSQSAEARRSLGSPDWLGNR